MRRLLLLLVLFLLGATSAPNFISVDILARVGLAPCTVRWRVRVQRDPRNRILLLEVDGLDGHSSSAIQLDGAESPVYFERFVEVRAGGCVLFAATVIRADGRYEAARVWGSYAGRGQDEMPACGN